MLRAGDQIGKYAIESLIGSGGTASVFLARHVELGRLVAVKQLHPHLAPDEEIRARFLSEARLQATLASPNVVRVIDVVEADGIPAILMEYLPEGSLADLIDTDVPIAIPVVLGIAADVLNALIVAHASGVVHRDLKPDNILLRGVNTPELQAFIGDFGIARVVDEARRTGTGSMLGTLAYMSPEQVTDSARVDPRSDIYSLGVTVWEAITGERPYGQYKSTDPRLLLAVATEPLPAIARPVPPGLAEWVVRATAKDADARYSSAVEARQVLLSALGRSVSTSSANMFESALPTRREGELSGSGASRSSSVNPRPRPTTLVEAEPAAPAVTAASVAHSLAPSPLPFGAGTSAPQPLPGASAAASGPAPFALTPAAPTSIASTSPAPSPLPFPVATHVSAPHSSAPLPVPFPSAKPEPYAPLPSASPRPVVPFPYGPPSEAVPFPSASPAPAPVAAPAPANAFPSASPAPDPIPAAAPRPTSAASSDPWAVPVRSAASHSANTRSASLSADSARPRSKQTKAVRRAAPSPPAELAPDAPRRSRLLDVMIAAVVALIALVVWQPWGGDSPAGSRADSALSEPNSRPPQTAVAVSGSSAIVRSGPLVAHGRFGLPLVRVSDVANGVGATLVDGLASRCEDGEFVACVDHGPATFWFTSLTGEEKAEAVRLASNGCVPGGGAAAMGACHNQTVMMWAGWSEDDVVDEEIFVRFRTACAGGSDASCASAEVLRSRGIGATEDPRNAFDEARDLCRRGSDFACVAASEMALNGLVALRTDTAEPVLEAGCGRSDGSLSCFALGRLRERMAESAADHSAVYRSFTDACSAGDPEGCTSAALMREAGRGCDADPSVASAALNDACKAGVTRACVHAMRMHAEGIGDQPTEELRVRVRRRWAGTRYQQTAHALLTPTYGEFSASWLERTHRGCLAGDSEACRLTGRSWVPDPE